GPKFVESRQRQDLLHSAVLTVSGHHAPRDAGAQESRHHAPRDAGGRLCRQREEHHAERDAYFDHRPAAPSTAPSPGPQPSTWRSASYRTMATALLRLRLRALPAGMGMTSVRSAWRASTSSGNPRDSLPNSRVSPG